MLVEVTTQEYRYLDKNYNTFRTGLYVRGEVIQVNDEYYLIKRLDNGNPEIIKKSDCKIIHE